MKFAWEVAPMVDLAGRIEARLSSRRPAVLAITGHSSSGKTTLAARLQAAYAGSAVMHTDDLAWHQGVFAWGTLLIHDVLPVIRSGRALCYRPPQWQDRDRDGAIEVPGNLDLLIIEGVGASQPSIRPELDLVIWVETDEPTRLARDAVRIAAGEISPASFSSWMAEEDAYVIRDQPWRHADLIVYGGDSIDHDGSTDVVLAELG